MLTFDPPSAEDRTVTIHLEEAGTFDLIVRPPTLGDELASMFSRNGDARRLQTAIVGWSGLKDSKGHDVPYTPAALAGLIRRYPDAAHQIGAAVLNLYGEPESDLGNSEPPRNDSSEGQSAATTSKPLPS